MLSRAKKAFTLIELIAVVVVLGILAALAVPTFAGVKTEAQKEIVTRSAEGIVNEAEALAAFDGSALNGDLINQAATDGLPNNANWNNVNNTLSIENAGKTASVVISDDGSIGEATVA